jgi:hypothetical protein
MVLCPVSFAVARVAFHQGARSRGYKFSREEADLRSLVSDGGDVWVCSSYCGLIAPLDMAPVSPFIASKGRSWVTFVLKG